MVSVDLFQDIGKLKFVNYVLAFLVVLLFLTNFGSISRITGRFLSQQQKDTYSNKECYFNNSGEVNSIPMDDCCLEVMKQLKCEKVEGKWFECYITSAKVYKINKQGINYCREQGYEIRTE